MTSNRLHLVDDAPDWLTQARDLEGWSEKGAPHEKSLLAWKEAKGYSDEALEDSVNGMNTVSEKVYYGYRNLAAALQRRVKMGYDRPKDYETPAHQPHVPEREQISPELRERWKGR